MWKLVRLSLSYHRKALLWAWLAALLLSEVGLLILAIVSVYLISAEDKERRLLLHLPLPVTRLQVGWARVAFPAVVMVVGAAANVLLSSGVLNVVFSSGMPAAAGMTVAEAVWDLLLFAAVLVLFSQLLLMLGELNLWGTGHGLPRLLIAVAAVLIVLTLTLGAWLVMATTGSHLVVVLGTLGLALVLMGITVVVFEQRRSFTTA